MHVERRAKRTPARAHDEEAHADGLGDARELCPVGLGALLHEVHGVLHELLQGLHDHGVDVGHGEGCVERKPSRPPHA